MRIRLEWLEKILLYLFIFSLPFQARLIIGTWQPEGLGFNEWTSGFLYGTDLLLLTLLALWLWRTRARIAVDRTAFVLGLFLIIAGISIWNAHSMEIALFRWLKLVEWSLLFMYVRGNRQLLMTRPILWTLIAAGVFQSLIALAQSLTQRSLGLRWLGESSLAKELQGVAVFIVDGTTFLRAYGTTPHPSVLAVFLFAVLMALTGMLLLGQKSRREQYLLFSAFTIVTWAFLLTFSRTIIGVWGLAAGVFLGLIWYRHGFVRVRSLVLVLAAVGVAFSALYWPHIQARANISTHEEAVTHRILYAKLAGRATGSAPLLGSGVGQFVYVMMERLKQYQAYLFQPVHNMYLLISSEMGLIGLGAFIVFLIRILSRRRVLRDLSYLPIFLTVAGLLLIGIFDHLLWTLQQGSLVFWLSLGAVSTVAFKG